MTDCAAVREAASARLDGELPAADQDGLAGHLAACPPCKAHFDALARVREAMGRLAPGADVPAALRARIEARAMAVAARLAGRRRAWLAGMAAVAAAGLVFGLPPWLAARSDGELARLMIGDHVGFLPHAGAGEIRSGDPRAVERWLGARLSLAARALTLPEARLTGARVCHVGGKRAAVLFYECAGRRVSLFVLPQPPGAAWGRRPAGPMVAVNGGFHLSCLDRGGVRYALVADLAPERLGAMLETGLARL